MSEKIAELENIFKILHQDHSYFLKQSEMSKVDEFKAISAEIERPKSSKIVHKCHSWMEHEAAMKITKFLRKYSNKKIFRRIKTRIYKFMHETPPWLLKRLDHMCFTLFEKHNYTIIFRLAGETFPPHIVYKIYGRQYVISSYNFSTLEERNKPPKNQKSIFKQRSIQHEDWRVCYVYKKEIMNKFTSKSGRFLPDYRKKSNNITWINEKYGR